MAAMVAMVEESPRIPRSRAESAVRFPDVPNHAPVSKDKSKTNILKRSFWLNVIGSRDPQVQKPPQEAGSAAGSASAARPTNGSSLKHTNRATETKHDQTVPNGLINVDSQQTAASASTNPGPSTARFSSPSGTVDTPLTAVTNDESVGAKDQASFNGSIAHAPIDSIASAVDAEASPGRAVNSDEAVDPGLLARAGDALVHGKQPAKQGAMLAKADDERLFSPKKNIRMGRLTELPPLEDLSRKWDTELKVKATTDIEGYLSKLSSKHKLFEADLYMVGKTTSTSGDVELLPTVWIACVSKKCKRSVQEAVQNMPYLHNFSVGEVEIHIDLSLAAAAMAKRQQQASDTSSAPRLSTGAIVGIVFASLFCIGFIVSLLGFFWVRKKKIKGREPPIAPPMEQSHYPSTNPYELSAPYAGAQPQYPWTKPYVTPAPHSGQQTPSPLYGNWRDTPTAVHEVSGNPPIQQVSNTPPVQEMLGYPSPQQMYSHPAPYAPVPGVSVSPTLVSSAIAPVSLPSPQTQRSPGDPTAKGNTTLRDSGAISKKKMTIDEIFDDTEASGGTDKFSGEENIDLKAFPPQGTHMHRVKIHGHDYIPSACGLSIEIQPKSRVSALKGRKCTMGGLILVGDNIVGLTTAHTFFTGAPLAQSPAVSSYSNFKRADSESDDSDSDDSEGDSSVDSRFSYGSSVNRIRSSDSEAERDELSDSDVSLDIRRPAVPEGETIQDNAWRRDLRGKSYYSAKGTESWTMFISFFAIHDGSVTRSSESQETTWHGQMSRQIGDDRGPKPANSIRISSGADFALVEVEPKVRVRNCYESPDSKKLVDITRVLRDEQLSSGPVSILTGGKRVHVARLLDRKSTLFISGKTFDTRKVELKEFLPDGCSGSWVVRDDALCGCIIATYKRMPFAHLITAQKMLNDVASQYGSTVSLPQARDFGQLWDSHFLYPRFGDLARMPEDEARSELDMVADAWNLTFQGSEYRAYVHERLVIRKLHNPPQFMFESVFGTTHHQEIGVETLDKTDIDLIKRVKTEIIDLRAQAAAATLALEQIALGMPTRLRARVLHSVRINVAGLNRIALMDMTYELKEAAAVLVETNIHRSDILSSVADMIENILDHRTLTKNIDTFLNSGNGDKTLRRDALHLSYEVERLGKIWLTGQNLCDRILRRSLRAEEAMREGDITGCITCRRLRLNCSEERPICHNCANAERKCEGYDNEGWVSDKFPERNIETVNSKMDFTLREFESVRDRSNVIAELAFTRILKQRTGQNVLEMNKDDRETFLREIVLRHEPYFTSKPTRLNGQVLRLYLALRHLEWMATVDDQDQEIGRLFSHRYFDHLNKTMKKLESERTSRTRTKAKVKTRSRSMELDALDLERLLERIGLVIDTSYELDSEKGDAAETKPERKGRKAPKEGPFVFKKPQITTPTSALEPNISLAPGNVPSPPTAELKALAQQRSGKKSGLWKFPLKPRLKIPPAAQEAKTRPAAQPLDRPSEVQ